MGKLGPRSFLSVPIWGFPTVTVATGGERAGGGGGGEGLKGRAAPPRDEHRSVSLVSLIIYLRQDCGVTLVNRGGLGCDSSRVDWAVGEGHMTRCSDERRGRRWGRGHLLLMDVTENTMKQYHY